MKIFFLVLNFLICCSTLCNYDAVIFDVFGVLFTIPIAEKLKHMGFTPINALVQDWENIFNFKNDYFKVLSKIELDQSLLKIYEDNARSLIFNEKMPALVYLWQANIIPWQKAIDMSIEFITENIQKKYQKEMLEKAIMLTFDPEIRRRHWKPMQEGIEILQQCAKQNKYKLYVLSNMDHEMMDILISNYPNVFSLFDGIVYSAQEQCLKPEKDIYNKLLERYSLDPKKCIFIDDQQENIDAANELGITSLLCKKHSLVKAKLSELKILY